jgi:hypothetical protein
MTIAAVLPQMTEEGAERLSSRISARLDGIADNYVAVMPLIREALNRNVYDVLGYPSHGAYVKDRFGDALGKLGIELRREIVRELSSAGLSTRAIAPVVGVSDYTVRQDIAAGARSLAPDPTSYVPAVIVNESTGEVIDDAPVTSTDTHTTKVVHGLDGKSYPVAPLKPKPADDDAANRQNAETAAKEIAQAIDVMWRFGHVAHRTRILTDWWPLGKGAVAPVSRGLFNPGQLRQIAGSLEQLATEMEQLDVH